MRHHDARLPGSLKTTRPFFGQFSVERCSMTHHDLLTSINGWQRSLAGC